MSPHQKSDRIKGLTEKGVRDTEDSFTDSVLGNVRCIKKIVDIYNIYHV